MTTFLWFWETNSAGIRTIGVSFTDRHSLPILASPPLYHRHRFRHHSTFPYLPLHSSQHVYLVPETLPVDNGNSCLYQICAPSDLMRLSGFHGNLPFSVHPSVALVLQHDSPHARNIMATFL
jgi:hypothetical protein